MFSPENRAKAEALVDRYPRSRSALLPLLHLVQHQDGYVTDEGVAECAELLGLTKAEVGAVATFFTMYKRAPLGQHLVSVCTNFSCVVRGAQEVYDRLREHLGVGHDQTTPDGGITLEHAECLGNCEGAPVVTVDYLNYEAVTPDGAVAIVEACRAGEPLQPTRGFVPPGIRAVQHRLAGIGPLDPSLPGQRLGLSTKEHGAPPVPDAGPGVDIRHLQWTPAEQAISGDGAAAAAAASSSPSGEDAQAPAVMTTTGGPDGPGPLPREGGPGGPGGLPPEELRGHDRSASAASSEGGPQRATRDDSARTGEGDYAGSESRPDEAAAEAAGAPRVDVPGEAVPDDASVSRSDTTVAEQEDRGA